MSIRPLRRAIAGVAIAVMSAAGLAAVETQTASAVSTCTLKASLPSRVVVNKKNMTIYATLLRGSGSCQPSGGEFYGADAFLDGPDGTVDYPFWTKIGQKYRSDFYASDVYPGTYTVSDGEAGILTKDGDEVPIHWKATRTSIRFGSKISIATKRSGHKVTVTGKAMQYTYHAEYKAYKTKVYLQRKAKSANTYKTYKTLKSSSTGKISYSYAPSKKYDYRLMIKNASGVWGSTSVHSYR